MVYQQRVKYLRIAPKKLSLMGKAVVGMNPATAQEFLSVQRQKAAGQLATAIGTAINNAAQVNIDLASTVIIGISAQKGPVFMRRFIVSKGRAMPKRKPTSHTLILFGKPKAGTKKAVNAKKE